MSTTLSPIRAAMAAGVAGVLLVTFAASAGAAAAAGTAGTWGKPPATYDHHDRDDYENDDDYERDRDRDRDRKRDRRDDRKRDREHYDRVPADARLVDEGKGELSYVARRDGRVYLYDPKLEKVIYTGRMWRGEEFVTDPPGNRVLIDGKTVMDEIMKKKNFHEIYFLRD